MRKLRTWPHAHTESIPEMLADSSSIPVISMIAVVILNDDAKTYHSAWHMAGAQEVFVESIYTDSGRKWGKDTKSKHQLGKELFPAPSIPEDLAAVLRAQAFLGLTSSFLLFSCPHPSSQGAWILWTPLVLFFGSCKECTKSPKWPFSPWEGTRPPCFRTSHWG